MSTITRVRSIIGMGQSLGNGSTSGASSPVTTTQPYNNVMFHDRSGNYDITKTTQNTLFLRTLLGPVRSQGNAGGSYPADIANEDINLHAANQLAALITGVSWASTCVAIGGMNINGIKKSGSTNAYAAALWETGRLAAMAQALGLGYDIAAILLTHGEADSLNATYAADVYNGICLPAQTDYAGLIGGILPTFASQQSTTPSSSAAPLSALQILAAETTYPGYVYCYGPKYSIVYGANNQHPTTCTQHRLMGEKAGQAIYQRLVNGLDIGLKPLSYALSNSNKTVTITCNVFAPPIVIDGTITANHQSVNTQWGPTGLEAKDDSGNLQIDSVVVDGTGTKLIVTLHTTPTTGLKIGAALTPDTTGTFQGGLGNGGRYTQIHDSDTFVGAVSGTAQKNYLVHFQSAALT